MAVVNKGAIQANTRVLSDPVQTLQTSLSVAGLIATMNSIHLYFTNKTASMFRMERDVIGEKWAPLAPATKSWRTSLGFPVAPINTRTGKMRDYMTPAKADIVGTNDTVSYAFPRRSAPPNDMLIRLKQAGGEMKGPARTVVGMSGEDAAYVIGYINSSIVGHFL